MFSVLLLRAWPCLRHAYAHCVKVRYWHVSVSTVFTCLRSLFSVCVCVCVCVCVSSAPCHVARTPHHGASVKRYRHEWGWSA